MLSCCKQESVPACESQVATGLVKMHLLFLRQCNNLEVTVPNKVAKKTNKQDAHQEHRNSSATKRALCAGAACTQAVHLGGLTGRGWPLAAWLLYNKAPPRLVTALADTEPPKGLGLGQG